MKARWPILGVVVALIGFGSCGAEDEKLDDPVSKPAYAPAPPLPTTLAPPPTEAYSPTRTTEPTTEPTTVARQLVQTRQTKRPVVEPVEEEPVEREPVAFYANCKQAPRPLHRGEPGYRKQLDRDGDGVACEGA